MCTSILELFIQQLSEPLSHHFILLFHLSFSLFQVRYHIRAFLIVPVWTWFVRVKAAPWTEGIFHVCYEFFIQVHHFNHRNDTVTSSSCSTPNISGQDFASSSIGMGFHTIIISGSISISPMRLLHTIVELISI